MTDVMIMGEYLGSTVEGTPNGTGVLKVNKNGIHLAGAFGKTRETLAWADLQELTIEAEDDVEKKRITASRVALLGPFAAFAQKQVTKRGGALITVTCRDGRAVAFHSKPSGGKGTYLDVKGRLAPYLGLVKQST